MDNWLTLYCFFAIATCEIRGRHCFIPQITYGWAEVYKCNACGITLTEFPND